MLLAMTRFSLMASCSNGPSGRITRMRRASGFLL
jgi:hypothetical protein